MKQDTILETIASQNYSLASYMRQFPASYRFEWYQRRPVYVVQVYTAAIARQLGCLMIRCYKRHSEHRNAVALEVRKQRKSARPTPYQIREVFERIHSDQRGLAVRVDFAQVGIIGEAVQQIGHAVAKAEGAIWPCEN